MFGQHAAERARALGPLERVEAGAEVDVVLEPLDADRDHADQRERDTRRSAARAGRNRRSRCSACAGAARRAGAAPAISKAGKISTAKTRTNVANPISRSGARTSGLAGRDACRAAAGASRRRRARARAERAASQAMTRVGTTARRQSPLQVTRRLANSRRASCSGSIVAPCPSAPSGDSPRDLVAHGPQLREEPDVDALAEHFDRRTLRADHVAADDPLDDLQVMKPPEDVAARPR